MKNAPSDAADPHRPVRRDGRPGDGAARGTARMEAFADAVFAIAFTLPVVEIKMPEGGPRFGEELLALWPSYLGYGVASLIIGLYWVHHHFSGAIYRTTGHYFNVATVLFLAAIGFIAYPARAFADNIADPAARADGAIALTLALGATGLTWWIKWRTGRAHGHVDDRLDPAYVDRLDRKYAISTLILVGAAALSFLSWEAGLGIAFAVTLSYLRAPETPVYVREAPTVEGEEE